MARAWFSWWSALALAVSSVGCGDDSDEGPPADVSGSYSLNVTNGDNDCGVENWTEGESSTNIPFEITQEGAEIQGTIGGAAAIIVALVTGSIEFEGTVTGNSFELTNYGTISHVEDGCGYTYNVRATGTLTGHSIAGTIVTERSPNDDPDCAYLACRNFQEFSGSRPPR
nr:MAG: hypothetical protein DIU78_01640 [Pseudomonadota bacterium]